MLSRYTGADLGEGARGAHPPPPPPEMTFGFLIQLVFCEKKNVMFIGVEVEKETSAPPPKTILDPPLIYIYIYIYIYIDIDIKPLISQFLR